ncbi:MAG: hypothetical protein D3906_03345 [Candidatus Electrothrix sp. AUS1_2]|nr:hypothetical protein [Candidatus Electrothrix sp. AUS1_2]
MSGFNRDKTCPIPDDMVFMVRVKGRIAKVQHINSKSEDGGFFQTWVSVPAPDEYAHPRSYPVNASAPLGPEMQHVDVVCDLRSYPRKGYPNYSLWLHIVDQGKNDGKDVAF